MTIEHSLTESSSQTFRFERLDVSTLLLLESQPSFGLNPPDLEHGLDTMLDSAGGSTSNDLEYAPDMRLDGNLDDDSFSDTQGLASSEPVRCISINCCLCSFGQRVRLSRRYCLCLASLIIVVGLGVMGTFIALYTTFMVLWFT